MCMGRAPQCGLGRNTRTASCVARCARARLFACHVVLVYELRVQTVVVVADAARCSRAHTAWMHRFWCPRRRRRSALRDIDGRVHACVRAWCGASACDDDEDEDEGDGDGGGRGRTTRAGDDHGGGVVIDGNIVIVIDIDVVEAVGDDGVGDDDVWVGVFERKMRG